MATTLPQTLVDSASGGREEMAHLFPLLPFIADETPMSWAARQAAFHTTGRLIPFLNDLRIPVGDLARGQAEAVIQLCDKAGADPTPVLNNTISAIGGRRYRLRHLEFAAEFTTGPEMRFCPLCLREDNADGRPFGAVMRHRLSWCLMPVRTCGVHNLELQVYREGKWDDHLRDLRRLSEADEGHVRDGEMALQQRNISPLQAYVEGRLVQRGGPDWLDCQDIDQAIRAAEMLGGLAMFGVEQSASAMTQTMWDEAGRAAWPIVSGGEAAIRTFLIDQIRPTSGKRGLVNPVGAFGMLYRWLSASRLTKDPGPIRTILRNAIVEATPVSIGQNILGVNVAHPRLTTLASIAKTSRMHQATLLNVLHVAGLVSDVEKGNPIVNYSEVDALVEAASNAIPVTWVPHSLSASRPMVAALIELRLLTRVQDHNVSKSKIGKAIDRRSIEALVQRLETDFPLVAEVPRAHASLSKAAEKTRATLKAILELLFSGHLKSVVRLAGQQGFAAIMISPQEVRQVFESPPPGVSDEVRFQM